MLDKTRSIYFNNVLHYFSIQPISQRNKNVVFVIFYFTYYYYYYYEAAVWERGCKKYKVQTFLIPNTFIPTTERKKSTTNEAFIVRRRNAHVALEKQHVVLTMLLQLMGWVHPFSTYKNKGVASVRVMCMYNAIKYHRYMSENEL